MIPDFLTERYGRLSRRWRQRYMENPPALGDTATEASATCAAMVARLNDRPALVTKVGPVWRIPEREPEKGA